MIYQAIFMILILFFCFIFEHEKKRADKRTSISVLAIGLLLFLFAALRSKDVGSDTIKYYNNFNVFSNIDISEIFSYYKFRDPVFRLFEKALSWLSNDPRILLTVIAASVSVCFLKLAKTHNDSFTMMIVLFVSLRVYSFTMTGLRQALAMSMCWIAAIRLQEKRYVEFGILTVIGALFHSTALVFLLALPISRIKKPMYVLVTSVSIALFDIVTGHMILRYLSNSIYSGRFSNYFDEASSSVGGASTTFILYILFLAVISAYINKTCKIYSNERIIPIYNLAIVAVVLSFAGQSFPNMFRISYYFIIFLFQLVNPTINVIFSENSRFAARWIVMIVLATQYIIFGSGAGTDNYTFFWSQIL